MKRLPVLVLAAVVAASLVTAGCATAAPAASPTKAPAVPTRAAEPTRAPAAPTAAPAAAKAPAEPTAAPAKKVAFPEKGKAVSMIVGYAAGGATDVGARLLASAMEKELGVPVEVVNRAGAGGQIGLTELARAKPDGYTIGFVNLPPAITTYLDPERKAAFTRKDFQPVALHVSDIAVIPVASNSPYKTLKDLVDEAKANPDKIKAGTSGILTTGHLNALSLEKATGAKFAAVHFDGDATAMPALVGGHIDTFMSSLGGILPHYRNGNVRILAVLDKEESKLLPGARTIEGLGYKMPYVGSDRGIAAPAGTPKEFVDILSAAVKRGTQTEDHQKKIEQMGITLRYMDPAQFGAHWDEKEARVKELMSEFKK